MSTRRAPRRAPDPPADDPGAARRRGPGPAQRRRSAETRGTVVRATLDLIAAGGVPAATAAAISQRSGVSWGGIQHQFGGKDGVLDSALAQVIAELASLWDPGPEPAGPIEDRARSLVDVVWRTVCHPSYPSLLELLRHRASTATEVDTQVLRLRGGTTGATAALFADLDLDQDQLDLIDAFCFAALGGIADQLQVARQGPAFTERSRELVVTAVLTVLTRGS